MRKKAAPFRFPPVMQRLRRRVVRKRWNTQDKTKTKPGQFEYPKPRARTIGWARSLVDNRCSAELREKPYHHKAKEDNDLTGN